MESQLKAHELQAYMKQLRVGLQEESPVGKKERRESWKENQADLLRERGNRHFRAGRTEDACSAYSASIEAGPSSAALANRAMAYLKLGELEKCIADCDRCLDIDRLYVKAYLRRGTARKCSNVFLQAIMDFEEALRLEPHNESAIENRRVCIDKIRNEYFRGKEPTKMEIPVTICGINAVGNSLSVGKHAQLDAALLKPMEVKRKRPVETKDMSDQRHRSPTLEMKEDNINETQKRAPEKRDNMLYDGNKPLVCIGKEGDTRQKLKPPKTGIEFEKTWRSFKGERKSQLEYLLMLNPKRVPILLRQSFSPKMLYEVASLLLKDGIKIDADTSLAILESMTHTDRFDMNLISLSKSQRGILQDEWMAAAKRLDRNPEMDTLKMKYKLD